jgi:endonuclease YncB( thermonuclease family)
MQSVSTRPVSPDNPESFTGKVTYIVDGDSFSFSTKGQLVRITLNEIDALEMSQPWSNDAYSFFVSGEGQQ